MNSKRFDIKICINLVLLLLIMGLIFSFSSQPAVKSAEVSGFFADKVLRILEKLFKQTASQDVETVFSALDHYVRKFGHFSEYFILGLLTVNLFCAFFKEKSRSSRLLMSISFCALYAASDEVHQIFVPGRGPGVGDVLLDSVSAAAAIILVLLIRRKVEIKIIKGGRI